MEETILIAKRSIVALCFKLCVDLIACAIFIGVFWLIKDLIRYFTIKLEITNKRVIGKIGFLNTDELNSPLNKINSVRVSQGMFGKMFNYGNIEITTASSIFKFDCIQNPNKFRTILNNQIEAYYDNKMDVQAKKIAGAINKN